MQSQSQSALGGTYQHIIEVFRSLNDETHAQLQQKEAQFQPIQQTQTLFQQTLTRIREQIVEDRMAILAMREETLKKMKRRSYSRTTTVDLYSDKGLACHMPLSYAYGSGTAGATGANNLL